jgi:hypothetical protein
MDEYGFDEVRERGCEWERLWAYIAAADADVGDADEDVVWVEGRGDGFVF